MPHNPDDPITIRGGSVEIELPMMGMRSMESRKPQHVAFRGHTPQDRITRIVIKNPDGSIAFESDKTSGAEKCTIEIFFDHH